MPLTPFLREWEPVFNGGPLESNYSVVTGFGRSGAHHLCYRSRRFTRDARVG
jgi:hypothetical protein